MKQIAIILFIIFLKSIGTFGQQSISDLISNAKELTKEYNSIFDLDVLNYYGISYFDNEEEKLKYLISDNYNEKSISLAKIKEEKLLTSESFEELDRIFNLDVFGYYNLDDYDTKLKMSVFMKTDEYKNKLAELIKIKSEACKTTYFIKLEEQFVNNDYDINRKGFLISPEMGESTGFSLSMARTPKSIENILLKGLPTTKKGDLFLSITEFDGLEIEKNQQNINLYYFFIPSGKEKTTFKYYNASGNSNAGWYNLTRENIKSDKVRVIVANKLTGKIYFDKVYVYQPKPIVKAKQTETKK